MLENTATFEYGEVAGSAMASVPVEGRANLSTSGKTVDKTSVRPGDTLTYTVTLHNTGSAPVTVRVDDLLLPFVAVVDAGPWLGTPAALYWTGTVTEGASIELPLTVRLDGAAPLDHGSTFNNTAAVSDLADPNAPPLLLASPLTTVIKNTALYVDKSVETGRPGRTRHSGHLHGQLANWGDTAADVVLTDTLPTGIAFGVLLDPPVGATVDAGAIRWQGMCVFGQPVVLRYTGVITTNETFVGAVLSNTATFEYQGTTGSDTAQVQVQGRADVSTSTKTVDKTSVRPGELLTFTITVRNTGSEAASVRWSIPSRLSPRWKMPVISCPARRRGSWHGRARSPPRRSVRCSSACVSGRWPPWWGSRGRGPSPTRPRWR